MAAGADALDCALCGSCVGTERPTFETRFADGCQHPRARPSLCRCQGRRSDSFDRWRLALENMSHGMYLNDSPLYMNDLIARPYRQGKVFSISRLGIFLSDDGGDRWRNLPLEPLNPKGHTYCRSSPRTMWVAGAAHSEAMSACFCAVPTAAKAGRRSTSASSRSIRCSIWPSTSASRTGCLAPPMEAKYSPVSMAAIPGLPIRHSRAERKFTPWRAPERARSRRKNSTLAHGQAASEASCATTSG